MPSPLQVPVVPSFRFLPSPCFMHACHIWPCCFAQEVAPLLLALLSFSFVWTASPPMPVRATGALTNCDSIDVHRTGVPLGWPIRWSSLLFALAVLAWAEVVASAWSKALHYKSTPLDFMAHGGLPMT